MIAKPTTDRVSALAAHEFVWDTTEHTEIHSYIHKPILTLLQSHNVQTVPDLGCGNGSLTGLLATDGFQVTGVVHSLSGNAIAQQQFERLTFAQFDISDSLSHSYYEKFDAVVSVEVIEHLLLPRKLMENALAALKPGGLLVITTPFHGYWKNLALALTNKYDDHWHPLRDYGHIKFFSKSTVLSLFNEFDLAKINFQTVGRIPALARSMIVSATKR